MAPEDLREYAGLTTTTIVCKQRITLSAAGIDLIKWALEGTFGAIEEIGRTQKRVRNGAANSNGNGVACDEEVADEEIDYSPYPTAYLVMGCVIVRHQNSGEVEIEWEGNILNDGIADAILAVLFTVESSPAAVKRTGLSITYVFFFMLTGYRIVPSPSPSPQSIPTQPSCQCDARGALLAPVHVSRSTIRPSNHTHHPTQTPTQDAVSGRRR